MDSHLGLWNPSRVESTVGQKTAESRLDARIGWALAAVACGLGLMRFLRLGAWSLWIDEVYTLADALHGEGLRNPVGYVLFEWLLEALPGRASEAELRWIPAAAGWLSIPLAFACLRPFGGSVVAGAVALILAASNWHLYWSQTARFYTLALDLLLLGVVVLGRGFRANALVPVLVGLVLIGVGGLTHPSVLFVLPACVVGPFLLRRLGTPICEPRVARVLLVLALGAVVARMPWGLEVWRKWQETEKSASPAHFVLTTGFYVGPALGAAALWGAWLAWVHRDPRQRFVLLLVATSVAVAMVASVVSRVSAQYVFVLLPWIAFLAALPLREGTIPRVWRAAYLGLLVIPLLVQCMLYFTTRHGERPRWREAYQYVWDQRGERDLVFGMEAPVGEYYLSPTETDLRDLQRTVAYLDTFRSESPLAWDRYGRTSWFVVNQEQLEDWANERDRWAFEELLRTECTLMASFPVQMEARDINVWVYRRPGR